MGCPGLRIFLAWGCLLAAKGVYGAERLACEAVTLRALDKITAHASELIIKVGEVIKFGTLTIALHQCWKNTPEDPPEALAFLDIKEIKSPHSIIPVFKGWMFASYPAVSGLEHPVYDVWVTKGVGRPLGGGGQRTVQLPVLPSPTPYESFDDPKVSPNNGEDDLPPEGGEDAIAALYRGLGEMPPLEEGQ